MLFYVYLQLSDNGVNYTKNEVYRLLDEKIFTNPVSCGFFHIYQRNPYRKTPFLCSNNVHSPVCTIHNNITVETNKSLHSFRGVLKTLSNIYDGTL